jgi:hypothetical protein
VAWLEAFGSSARVFKPTSSVPFGHGLGTAGASRVPWNAASSWTLRLGAKEPVNGRKLVVDRAGSPRYRRSM